MANVMQARAAHVETPGTMHPEIHKVPVGVRLEVSGVDLPRAGDAGAAANERGLPLVSFDVAIMYAQNLHERSGDHLLVIDSVNLPKTEGWYLVIRNIDLHIGCGFITFAPITNEETRLPLLAGRMYDILSVGGSAIDAAQAKRPITLEISKGRFIVVAEKPFHPARMVLVTPEADQTEQLGNVQRP